MNKFFNDYFNVSKIVESKREYRQQMNRVKALPEDLPYFPASHPFLID